MTHGEILKGIREARGMTQGKLSEVSGIAIGTLRNHEQDRHEMTVDNLFAYCHALQIDSSAFNVTKAAVQLNKRPKSLRMVCMGNSYERAVLKVSIRGGFLTFYSDGWPHLHKEQVERLVKFIADMSTDIKPPFRPTVLRDSRTKQRAERLPPTNQ